MSKLVLRWRKAVKGCANKSPKESLIDNDYLQPFLPIEEINYETKTVVTETQAHLYNDYDILQHQSVPKNLKPKSGLKEISSNNFTRGFKKVFSSKSLEKSSSVEDKENIDQNNNQLIPKLIKEKNKSDSNFSQAKGPKKTKNPQDSETYYCEIQDASFFFSDDLPLIDFKGIENTGPTSPYENRLKFTDSKSNLYNKFDEQQAEQNYADSGQSLNLMRELDSFVSPSEAFHWYLNLLFETQSKCIKNSAQLNDNERSKRLNICTAHLLYARNFYEMRIAGSSSLKIALNNVHPCLIALACLMDSDAVRIVESHSCTCDSYIYLFSTRLKFCAWKAKLYIILKRPKRSSIDRLTLIEDLTNCHKMIKETV